MNPNNWISPEVWSRSAAVARFGRNSPKPDLAVPNGIAQAIVDRVLPGRALAAVIRLQGGEMGAVYELRLAEAHPSLVLKVYPQEFQWKMQKEVAVCGRLDGRLGVPIPRILLADDSKSLLDLNFVVMSKLEGEILLALEDSLAKEEVLSAYTQMGRLLREFHQIGMEAFGYIGPHGLWTPQSTNHAYVTTRFEGKLEEFEAVAIKEVLAWQIVEAMKAQKLSRKRLAERMKTSRSQIRRLLDPKDGNVTITTLQRAAKMVGRTLRLELV